MDAGERGQFGMLHETEQGRQPCEETTFRKPLCLPLQGKQRQICGLHHWLAGLMLNLTAPFSLLLQQDLEIIMTTQNNVLLAFSHILPIEYSYETMQLWF